MKISEEIRHPTQWYSKLVAAALALVLFFVFAGAIVAGYVVYRIVAPAPPQSRIDMTNFPGHPEEVTYSLTDGQTRSGWFFPGLKSAPIVVLCPGYQTVRGDFLPLAAAIQEHGYNVFTFDIEGSSGRQYSALGYNEKAELAAGMAAISQRTDVDASRFGLWGTDLGAYVAFSAAENDPRVRALAVESVYNDPQDFAAILVERQGVTKLPLLASFAKKGFSWMYHKDVTAPPLSANVDRLAGIPKLFLSSNEDPKLARSTQDLFRSSPEPKQLEMLAHGEYTSLVDEEKRAYENRLVSFFLLNLPLDAPAKN